MAQGPKHEKKNSIKLFEKKIPFTPNGAESLSKNYQKKSRENNSETVFK